MRTSIPFSPACLVKMRNSAVLLRICKVLGGMGGSYHEENCFVTGKFGGWLVNGIHLLYP
jgi:hypothetical protein